MLGHTHSQKGFSLALALIFAGVLSSVLASLSFIQKGEHVRREAELAGIEGAQIARAARIFARNEYSARPNMVNELALSGSGPELITITDLINAGLLPPNYGRTNATGEDVNAVGHPIRIWLANYPIDGNPADPTTVPTAYVIFEDTDKTDTNIIQYIVQAIRAEDVAVSAPVYSGTVNVTGSCEGGGDTVAVWDTGCLDTMDYINLTGAAFTPGSFVIPTWRAVNFDTRAMMRFPQPEQPDVQTMFTDLEMGNMHDCSADPSQLIEISSDTTGTEDTDFCGAMDDDVGSVVDNRRDITRVNNIINTSAILIDPQGGDDVRSGGLIAVDTHDFEAVGNLSVERGDGKVFNGDTVVSGGLNVDKNISVSRTGGGADSVVSGNVIAGNAAFNQSVINAQLQSSEVSISGDMTNTNVMQSNSRISANRITRGDGANTVINVGNNADVAGVVELTTVNVSGTTDIGGFSVIAGDVRGQSLDISGNLNSANLIDTVRAGSGPAIPRIDITDGANGARCIGDCPRRRALIQCTNLAAIGPPTFTYPSIEACIDDFDI